MVVFERLYLAAEGEDDTFIISHEDLEDKDQTVSIRETEAKEINETEYGAGYAGSSKPKTGDTEGLYYWFALFLTAAVAGSVIMIRHKKNQKG